MPKRHERGRKSRHAVVHYGEIALKGQNRPFFERTLVKNIEQRLEHRGLEEVARLPGRFLVHVEQPRDEAFWQEALCTVFGIAYFAPAYLTRSDMAAIRRAILEYLPSDPVASFRISASRADKSFPLISPEIERELGAAVQKRTGWPVRLKRAELDIRVEILYDRAILFFGTLPGPRGLPVGVSGRVGLLLSGGIDSPVAGYLALKRGCQVVPIHFHSRPFGNWRGAERRVRAIVAALGNYGMEPFVYVVPIGRQQQEITVLAPPAYRVLLYRRLMVRVAEALARRAEARALVTGESLGQVASQTLESLTVVEEAVEMSILRPLVGMDKQETVDLAKQIGTFELSQMEADDCCQFLMPRRVVTRPDLEDVSGAEAKVEMSRLVEEALAQATCLELAQNGRTSHLTRNRSRI